MKIAIISNSDHTKIGGIENYNSLLIRHIIKQHTVVEFPINKEIIKVSDRLCKIDWSLSKKSSESRIKSINNIQKFIQKSNYDLYIISSHYYNKKILKMNNVIFIQHESPSVYNRKSERLDKKIHGWISAILGDGTLASPLKLSRNCVTYYGGKYSTIIPGRMDKFQDKNKNIRANVLFAGRYAASKGIDELNKISLKINSEIHAYGSGELEKKFHNKIIKKGHYKHKDIDNIFTSYKLLAMTSKNEGYEITIAESLSRGMPVVMFSDSTSSIKCFESCPGVFIIENRDIDNFSKKIDEIDSMDDASYLKLTQKTLSWSNKNISYEKFKNNWNKILNDIIMKNTTYRT